MSPKSLVSIAGALAALLLATFFGFVGWSKMTATLDDLARYHAWTIYLPEWQGRIVGVSEMLLAAGLITMLRPASRKVAGWSAALLVANQICGAAVHAAYGEADALPQNAALIALLAFVIWAARARSENEGGMTL
ncbi:DoxX family protein [Aquisediminimonas profunda]|uniref:DoxX family protein n=1 Tax=Aquisediminimonas profunda TaxID=1550733 RepID=UPI001FE38FE4|nr:DoxX family protein [Aquisediminimonas profunda]